MRKLRLSLLAALFQLLFLSLNTYGQTKNSAQPNIVLILADDLGWADIEPYGSRFYETPHLSALAQLGIRFTNAYAAAPICSPSRAAILTGKHPVSTGITDWLPGRQYMRGPQPNDKLSPPEVTQQLALKETTIAEILKTKGYVTASIGKWHLGDTAYYPTSQGFDINITGSKSGSPASYFYPYENGNYAFAELKKSGKEGEYLTDRLSAEAVKFIAANKEKPFFLYMSHYTPHIPLQPRQDLLEKYKQKAANNPDITRNNPYYAAMVESLDQSVGTVLAALKENSLEGNTIVIFTSDNGGLAVWEGNHTPATSNEPLRNGKGSLYEGGIRVPLLIRWPGVIKPATISDAIVSGTDFFQFLQEAAGLKGNGIQKTDGENIFQLLTRQTNLKREALYWHYPHYSNQGGKPSGAIRKGDYKLIEFFEDGRLELYNLKDDIGESKNLAETQPGKTAELHQLLKAWRLKHQAKMPSKKASS